MNILDSLASQFTPQGTLKIIEEALNEIAKSIDDARIEQRNTEKGKILQSNPLSVENNNKLKSIQDEEEQEKKFEEASKITFDIKAIQKAKDQQSALIQTEILKAKNESRSTDYNQYSSRTQYEKLISESIRGTSEQIEEKRQKQSFDNSKNINSYPSCIRNIARITQVNDPDVGIFYFAAGYQDSKYYSTLGFTWDYKYFDFETGKSGQFTCVNIGKTVNGYFYKNGQIKFQTGLYAEKYPPPSPNASTSSNLRAVTTNAGAVIDYSQQQKSKALENELVNKINKNKEQFKNSIKSGFKVKYGDDTKHIYQNLTIVRNAWSNYCLKEFNAFDFYFNTWFVSSQYYQNLTINVLNISTTILDIFPQTRVYGTILKLVSDILTQDLQLQRGVTSDVQFYTDVFVFILAAETPFIKNLINKISLDDKIAKAAVKKAFNNSVDEEGKELIKVLGVKIFKDNMKKTLFSASTQVSKKIVKYTIQETTGVSRESIKDSLNQGINKTFNETEAKTINTIQKQFTTQLSVITSYMDNKYSETQIKNILSKYNVKSIQNYKNLSSSDLNKKSPGYDPTKDGII